MNKNYEFTDPRYCYENGVLKNKLGVIESHEALNRAEGAITLKELVAKREEIRALPAFDPETLHKIHYLIFNKVFDWAGEEREVNVGKGGHWFATPQNIHSCLIEEFKKADHSFEGIVSLYNEINLIHPFRDGNGRTGRVWLNLALEQSLGKNIAFDEIARKHYMSAMESQDAQLQSELFSKALSDIDPQTYEQLWVRNAYESYYYEGYDIPHPYEKPKHIKGR